ncbi:hypothetical protein LTR97_007063 [Elasticomyces elasticus]|uniref:Uncharacterized protein n=1 Tax=Elasticomyces elasticus TaxID=574655 RepID=A0AAN8A1E2_9PEZI|nr:hypothetical protein LTR97_007063 [Elasticomyces elasticus]
MSPPKKKQKTSALGSLPRADHAMGGFDDAAQPASGDDPAQPPEDLLRKLPGEIRNTIYELVFPNQLDWQNYDDFIENAIRVRHRRFRPYERNSRTYLRWAEPGLLRAAKWIRSEVKLWYFQSTQIDIVVGMGDVAPACAWLTSVAAGDKEKWLGYVVLHLSSGRWNKIHTWLPLAQLFCDHDFDYTFGQQSQEEQLEEHADYHRVFHKRHSQLRGEHTRIARAMGEVIELGLKARAEKWSNDYLEIMYEEWAEATIFKKVLNGKHAKDISPMRKKMMKLERASRQQEVADNDYRYNGGGTIEGRGKSQITTRLQAALAQKEQRRREIQRA